MIMFIVKIGAGSLDLLVVLDHLEETLQLTLLVLVELSLDQCLGVDAVAHLLLELLQRCPQPVLVVLRGLDALLLELLHDLAPDFSHLEVRVQLDHLHFLLLHGVQLVFVEAHSVQDGEYGDPEVAAAHYLFYSIDQVGLGARTGEILQESLCARLFLLAEGNQRPLPVVDDSVLVLDSKSFILLRVQPD